MWKLSLARFVAIGCLITITGCAPIKKQAVKPSMTRIRFIHETLGDDMDTQSLGRAVAESVRYLKKIDPNKKFRFGARKVTAGEMIESAKRLAEIFQTTTDETERSKLIVREFDIYNGTGVFKSGNALVTGYFQPLLDGNRRRDAVFKWPLYRKPDDLITVDLGLFRKNLSGVQIRGRVAGDKLVPYHDRLAIDGDGAIADRGLEIVWVDDPVDVFFLHVQGSGVVRLTDGTQIFVNYASQNGREYKSIGRLLVKQGAVPLEKMSLGAIREYLANNPDKLETILYSNPSYVFFREMDDGPFGATGAKLVPGRSAAFDMTQFPGGAIAHISVKLPVIKDGKVSGWEETQRFVFNHDTGGAIKGAGHMDLFFGQGREAGMKAGLMKNPGGLRFLILKKR